MDYKASMNYIKKAFPFCFILFIATTVVAQEYVRPSNTQGNQQSAQKQPSSSLSDSLPRFYLGLGTGINNYVGIIGVGMDFRAYNNILIRAGVGIGTWGSKLTLGLRYELKKVKGKGWVMGLGYSYCTGIKNFTSQLAVDTGSSTGTATRQVTLDLNPASSLNLTATYNWTFHKSNIFYFEFGYAVALQRAPYVVLDGSVLDYSSVVALDLLSPGGLVIDCGFMFALK